MKDDREKTANEPMDSAQNGGARAPQGAARPGGYSVSLPEFDGPLDLLLGLIQEHELNILDIPIGFIATKYVEYITLMQQLNIDLASEYLVMAATLAHIKSKMLLPAPPEDQEEGEEIEIDPRAELVRRLLEYQKYKLAAEELANRDLLGRDVFVRAAGNPIPEGQAPLAPVTLFKLLEAFKRVLDRAHQTIDHQVQFERLSLTDRINELVDLLRERESFLVSSLFEAQRSRAELVVTLLALLEMTRLRMIRLSQSGPLEEISVELAVSEEQAMRTAAAAAAAGEGEAAREVTPAGPSERAESPPGEAEPASEHAGEGSAEGNVAEGAVASADVGAAATEARVDEVSAPERLEVTASDVLETADAIESVEIDAAEPTAAESAEDPFGACDALDADPACAREPARPAETDSGPREADAPAVDEASALMTAGPVPLAPRSHGAEVIASSRGGPQRDRHTGPEPMQPEPTPSDAPDRTPSAATPEDVQERTSDPHDAEAVGASTDPDSEQER